MEEITISERHLRDKDGQVILTPRINSARNGKTKDLTERSFWIATVSFICVFSIMVILLAVSMSSRTALTAKLNDMTEQYQTAIQQPLNQESTETNTSKEPQPEVCEKCKN